MAARRNKAPAVGSAQWILEERHQSNELMAQELEDFSFSVRNELEWLNEHMAEIFAHNGQNNLDVFKTPGKLRGKTPRTTRKKAAEPRQPLADLIEVNSQKRPSPAEQSLHGNLQKKSPAKSRFQIAADNENIAPAHSSPVKSPVPPPLFAALIGKGKENAHSNYAYSNKHASPERRPGTGHSTVPVHFSPMPSTQDTVMSGNDDDVFSPPQPQSFSTQPTVPTQSFRRSFDPSEDEQRDASESFVSANEVFTNKNAPKEDLHANYGNDVMDVDEKSDVVQSDAQEMDIQHELSSVQGDAAPHHEIADFPEPPRRLSARLSARYSISADTQDALNTADVRAHAPEPKNIVAPSELSDLPARAISEDVEQHDDTVVHHDIDDQVDMDDDVRSPSDDSSPVKPPVRKSSLTFASLPARQPLLANKSMGERVSRTSHIDQNKARASNLGRFTGGKSLGASQLHSESQHTDQMDDEEERPELRREESETTKIHNKTSSQRLLDRINMLKQQNEVPKRASQIIASSHSAHAQNSTSSQSQPKDIAHSSPESVSEPTVPASQPAYPILPAAEPERIIDDDEDDWISPIRNTAPEPAFSRPPLTKSYTDMRPSPGPTSPAKPISVSNPTELSTVVESTTPVGSPTALRAAKEKIIGSSAASAQVKLDALAESPKRPKLKAQDSSDDIFTSPKRNEKTGTSIFSHLRSPSKESLKSYKSKNTVISSSPSKDDGRRTRSSSERERQKEKDVRQKQRAEDKLKELREKEQSKAAAHYNKNKSASSKALAAVSSQQSLKQATAASTKAPVANSQQSQSRPGTTRTNTANTISTYESSSGDDMPPPPPPKSVLPTPGQKLREPKRMMKAPSKVDLAKSKPQKIMVNLNSSRYGQAPPAVSRPAAQPAPVAAPQAAPKPTPQAPKLVPVSRPGTAASNRAAPSSSKPAVSKPAPKAAARVGRPQAPKVVEKPVEKPKAPAPQPRADLASARPVARMQTLQDANRLAAPTVNPAKPPAKRPFQPDNDEPLYRPAKRPSQQAKMNPMTPAHAQFAKGKIPFAESAQSKQPAQPQYQNGDDIELPACVTDSEDDSDDDDKDAFEQPSWVNTPNLHHLLTQQQLVDPETIFGPIAPLNMEQVFPNKERHKKFRQRTSSAYWGNDQVTEEEKRKEREAKERLVKEGAWSYNPSPLGPPRNAR